MTDASSNTAEGFETRHPPNHRIRFSLRALFVVITLFAILFGWKTARYRAASEIVTRNNALVDLIERNVAECPADCTWVSSPPPQPAVSVASAPARFGRLQSADQSQQIIDQGRFYWYAEYRTILDASKLLDGGNIGQVERQISQHYARGLAEAGFHS